MLSFSLNARIARHQLSCTITMKSAPAFHGGGGGGGARAFAFEQIRYTPFVDPPPQSLAEKYENPRPPVRPHGFDWGEIRAEWTHSRTSN